MAAVLTCVAACGGADRPARSGFTVTDSAGVALVHNTGPGGAGDSLLSLEEELRLGEVEGPEHLQFFRVFRIAIDRAGRLYVGNGGSNEIRVFDADGMYLRAIGRQGGGPGEFQSLNDIVHVGDTLAVSDLRLYRVTLLRSDGTVLATWPLRVGALLLMPQGRADGEWLFLRQDYGAWPYEVGRPHRRRIAMVRGPTPAAAADSAAPVVAQYLEGRTFGIDAGDVMTANSPAWEPDPDHAVDGLGRVHVAHGSPYRIHTYGPDGRLIRQLTRDHEPVPVTAELKDRLYDKVAAYYDTTSNRGGEFELGRASQLARRDLPHPDVLPATGRIVASDDGALWVERPDLAPDPVRLEWRREGEPQPTYWDVFDPDGRLLGTAEQSARFGVRAVGPGGRQVIGVLRDELGVEYVVRYAVVLRPSS